MPVIRVARTVPFVKRPFRELVGCETIPVTPETLRIDIDMDRPVEKKPHCPYAPPVGQMTGVGVVGPHLVIELYLVGLGLLFSDGT